MKQLNKNKKGFTLVELIIVIAIIGILAAVLIPTFSGVMDSAKISAAEQEAATMYKESYMMTAAVASKKVSVYMDTSYGYIKVDTNGKVVNNAKKVSEIVAPVSVADGSLDIISITTAQEENPTDAEKSTELEAYGFETALAVAEGDYYLVITKTETNQYVYTLYATDAAIDDINDGALPTGIVVTVA